MQRWLVGSSDIQSVHEMMRDSIVPQTGQSQCAMNAHLLYLDGIAVS